MKKNFILLLVTVVLCVSFLPLKAERISFGFSSAELGGLSLRYWGKKIGFEGIMGFSFQKNNNDFVIGAKILKKLKTSKKLYLYGGGLTGLEFSKVAGNSTTDFILGSLGGVEVFLWGLSNLSFKTEIGVSFHTNNSIFRVFYGNWAIHYYIK